VEVAGEVKRPAVYDFDELLKPFTPAERVYRMQCVEGWSVVVPWVGIALGTVIDRLEPTSLARDRVRARQVPSRRTADAKPAA
jgi:sulfoxide reductase catalytic subunit YedY